MIDKKKNISLIVCILVLIIVGLLSYKLFFSPNEESTTSNEEETVETVKENYFADFEEITLTENAQNVVIDGKEVSISYKNDNYYINNEEYSGGWETLAYKTNKLLFVMVRGQCQYSIYVYDNNGNKISDDFPYQFDNLRADDGKILADGIICPCFDDPTCRGSVKASFEYSNGVVKLQIIESTIGSVSSNE